MSLAQTYINLADDLARAISRFQIENMNQGGTPQERLEATEVLMVECVKNRNIGAHLREEEAHNNVVDFTPYRLRQIEGWQ